MTTLATVQNRVNSFYRIPKFKRLSENASRDVKTAIEESQLDWEVEKRQAYTENGLPLDSWYLVKRGNQGQENSVLATNIGPDWTPVQNREKFDWFQPYLDSGLFELEGAGVINRGVSVSLLAKVKTENVNVEVVPGDMVGLYLNITDTFGPRALQVQGYLFRLVCANGMVSKEIGESFRIRHSRKVSNRLNDVRTNFNNVVEDYTRVMDRYKLLTNRQLSSEAELREYVTNVLELQPSQKTGELATRSQNVLDLISGMYRKDSERRAKAQMDAAIRAQNVEAIVAAHDGLSTNTTFAPGTYWSAYNAVTEWLNHYRGHNDETRLESLLYGQSAKIEQRALELALAS